MPGRLLMTNSLAIIQGDKEYLHAVRQTSVRSLGGGRMEVRRNHTVI